MARNQFTFYRSFWESIEKLETNKEKLQAYQLLCCYALDRQEQDLNGIKPCAATVFRIANPVLDTAYKRAEKILETRERKQIADNHAAVSALLDKD